jgi:triacylglycerol lipase
MVANATRKLILLELAIALMIATACTHWGHVPLVAGVLIGIAVVVSVRLIISANNFIVAWRYSSVTPEEHWLNWRQMLSLFLFEFYASMWSSSYAMPFKTFWKRADKHPNGLPVLLIHGYGCNSGYWHAMSKTLANANVTHYAINLEPVFGDIDHYAAMIHKAIETICAETGHARIIVVAHSMGGLATRAYMRVHGNGRVAQLITLGTPHHGTGIANFGVGMNCRQMHWRGDARTGTPSQWLRKLDTGEDPATRALIVSIYSHHDNIVSPQISSHLDGARNIEYQGIGHVALSLHPLIQARVLAEIRNASARELQAIVSA